MWKPELSAILSSMAEGIIAIDANGRIILMNPAFEEIFQIKAENSLGKFFLEVIRNNELNDILDNALKGETLVSKEIEVLLPVRKFFQINAVKIRGADIKAGALMVLNDITQIKFLESVRKDFVANVSHELKTPLTSIKGFVETLMEGAIEDKEKSRHFLKIIQQHSDRLDSLINDLLALSYLESKEIKLDSENLNLRDLAEEVLSGFRAQIEKKSLRVLDEIPQGSFIKADKIKLKQVFTNLIDNAIKFNKANGFIKIYHQDLNDKIKISFEDSGIGIPARDISRIFERFYRVDKARSREMGGTGLGLSIVRHIIELHRGSVGVESIEAEGATLWFTLPK